MLLTIVVSLVAMGVGVWVGWLVAAGRAGAKAQVASQRALAERDQARQERTRAQAERDAACAERSRAEAAVLDERLRAEGVVRDERMRAEAAVQEVQLRAAEALETRDVAETRRSEIERALADCQTI